MNIRFLKMLVDLEEKRNNFLIYLGELLFEPMYQNDWDDIELTLKDSFYKYNKKYFKFIEKKITKVTKSPTIPKYIIMRGSERISEEFEILDLDTGEIIKDCFYANQTNGAYKHYIPKINSKKYTIRQTKSAIAIVWKGEK